MLELLSRRWQLVVLRGVVAVLFGIVAGVTRIAAAIRSRKVIRNEWFLALSGAVALVLGVLLVVQPAEGAIAPVTAIAAFALAWGLVLIVLGFRLRALVRATSAGRPAWPPSRAAPGRPRSGRRRRVR